MKIITLNDNDLDQNTYIINLDDRIIIIDPGLNFKRINKYIYNQNPDIIFLSHGHYDHIASINCFDKSKIYAHIKEKQLLSDPNRNLSAYFQNPLNIDGINFLKGKIINFDNKIKIFHTPGHTEGSIVIIIKDNIFSGDTLFLDTIGRTDLPTGNQNKLCESLRIFSEFNKNSIVYPGHGKFFTLGHAFKSNNFLCKSQIFKPIL